MADVTFDCSLTCTSDAFLWVNDQVVNLDESSLTKTGRFTAQTGSVLQLRAQLTGVRDSAWTLDVVPECTGTAPPKLWTRNGTFKKGGITLSGPATVPDNPCASRDGLDLAIAHVSCSSIATPSKPQKSKKKNN